MTTKAFLIPRHGAKVVIARTEIKYIKPRNSICRPQGLFYSFLLIKLVKLDRAVIEKAFCIFIYHCFYFIEIIDLNSDSKVCALVYFPSMQTAYVYVLFTECSTEALRSCLSNPWAAAVQMCSHKARSCCGRLAVA